MEKQRIYGRIEYQKVGRLRFLGHLDVAAVFDRAVRRAELPVVYTKGFHPRAKLTFAQPLPLGVAGLHELCGIDLREQMSADQLRSRLSAQLPEELAPVNVEVLPRGKRSPFADIAQADYEITIDDSRINPEELRRAVVQFRQADRITIQRQTKSRIRNVDIRAGTYKLTVSGEGTLHLNMTLSRRQDDLVNVPEVLDTLAGFADRDSLPIKQIIRIALQ